MGERKIAFIPMDIKMFERLSVLAMDDIVGKVIEGAFISGDLLGNAIIISLEILLIEKIRQSEEIERLKEKLNEEFKIRQEDDGEID